jgi:hypothetical protein
MCSDYPVGRVTPCAPVEVRLPFTGGQKTRRPFVFIRGYLLVLVDSPESVSLADMRVKIFSMRIRRHQPQINRQWDAEVFVNAPAVKLDFKDVGKRIETHRTQVARLNRNSAAEEC